MPDLFQPTMQPPGAPAAGPSPPSTADSGPPGAAPLASPSVPASPQTATSSPEPEAGAPAPDVHEADDTEQPTPEEQTQYNEIVYKALNFIHDEKTQPKVLRMLQVNGEPYQAVAKATVLIVKSIEAQAKADRVKLSPDAMFHAAKDSIVPDLFEIGERAGVFKPLQGEEEQKQMGMALYEALRLAYAQLPKETKDALHQEAQTYMARGIAQEADNGTLDPNFKEYADRQYKTQMSPVAAAVQRAVQGI